MKAKKMYHRPEIRKPEFVWIFIPALRFRLRLSKPHPVSRRAMGTNWYGFFTLVWRISKTVLNHTNPMKKTAIISSFIAATLALAAPLAFVSCSERTEENIENTGESIEKDAARATENAERTGDQVARDAKQAGQEVSADVRREKEKLRVRLNAQANELDRELASVDKKIDATTAAEKVRWEKRKAKLKDEKDRLDANMAELGRDSKREWSEFKQNVENFADEVDRDLKNGN